MFSNKFVMFLGFVLVFCAVNAHAKKEGDVCTKEGVAGVCANIVKCPDAQQDIKNRIKPNLCEFTGIYPIVCCVSLETIDRAPVPAPVLSPAKPARQPNTCQKASVAPCVLSIPRGTSTGRMVRVLGFTPPDAKRFAINLQLGPSTEYKDEIALHLSPRFYENRVIRSYFASGNWRAEEVSGGMPLVRGEPFEAVILCGKNSFMIMLNGVHFTEFAHRLPYQSISHLSVIGDVTIQDIKFEKAQVVCTIPIPGGVYPGRVVRVQGSTPPDAQSFQINFQYGTSKCNKNDIAFHLSPRFNEERVIRSHLTNGNWRDEETSGSMPLTRGEPFEVVITTEKNSTKIMFDGVHFGEYSHRLPYRRVTHLSVRGDVKVNCIGFEDAQAPVELRTCVKPTFVTYGASHPVCVALGWDVPSDSC